MSHNPAVALHLQWYPRCIRLNRSPSAEAFLHSPAQALKQGPLQFAMSDCQHMPSMPSLSHMECACPDMQYEMAAAFHCSATMLGD